MKIALLHNSVLPAKNYGGIERIIVALAYEYRRLGHEVVVACRKESNLPDFETVVPPANYSEVSATTWLPKDIDFLHSHEPLPIKPEIPFLITIHGNGHPGEHYWKNTNFLSQSHCRNHGGKYFVFNGIDPDIYKFREEKDDYFVFLARASWRVKNVKTAIAWANDLGVRLEIMGGSGRDTKNIKYHGLIGEADGKVEILSKARGLIYPTNWEEPFGVALLEALASGTPVISSANGAMPELVRPGTGVVCRTYEEMLAAPAQLKNVTAKACRESVENFFTVKRMGQDYLALIEKIRQVGELDQQPHYNFDPSNVKYLFKPTVTNRMRFALTGKI